MTNIEKTLKLKRLLSEFASEEAADKISYVHELPAYKKIIDLFVQALQNKEKEVALKIREGIEKLENGEKEYRDLMSKNSVGNGLEERARSVACWSRVMGYNQALKDALKITEIKEKEIKE